MPISRDRSPAASTVRGERSASLPSSPTPQATVASPAALTTAQGVYITIHGHFYQPPRENPYLDAIERQPSAAPAHNWNERIYHECYRPNAFARIVNDQGEVIRIVNNFEYFSFNIGPTLMSWLERHDVQTYQRILEADRKSCQRLNGHGNAIAQAYNHMILPLANAQDKRTQIRWGKADFRSRFGRDPEGMWLAETAVDYPTLAALVAEGIRFIILAPSQAQRCRLQPTAEQPDPHWQEVGGSQIDTTRPYRCYLPHPENTPESSSGNGPEHPSFIDIFFYDGPISRDMGFDDGALSSSHQFANRLGQAVRGDHRPAQVIGVATDGETFGHHKGGTEKCLAYAFTHEFPQRGWTVTNFAHYLSLAEPTWTVELKPVTAWSCAHGVDRWQDACGCGAAPGWHLHWRRPLRDALDWLRDQLIDVFSSAGALLFKDPWQARDAYIQVILDRSAGAIAQFLSQHQAHKLSAAERVDALRLLEMQRHALLMYTSCGWFFEELSRPEGVQILRYAARALELAREVTGIQLEAGLVKRLAQAPTNIAAFKTGADVYDQLVKSAQVSLEQVGAHYAINSLFTTYTKSEPLYCYGVHQLDYHLQRLGNLTLAVGHVELTSEITQETRALVFAVLHLGGWDFHCCVQPFMGRRGYTHLKDRLCSALTQASAAPVILEMSQLFEPPFHSLQSLFPEERQRIMQLLSQETLTRLDQLYTQVYRDNYGVLMAFHRDGVTVPQELQVAAQIALGQRVLGLLRSLEQDLADLAGPGARLGVGGSQLAELQAIATEADQFHCHFQLPEATAIVERLLLRSLWHLIQESHVSSLKADLQRVEHLIQIGQQLGLGISLAAAQELYIQQITTEVVVCVPAQTRRGREPVPAALMSNPLLLRQLGSTLGVGVCTP
jgi:alpha-amylase/alpha-mannosidase (GH57 family)